MKSVSVHLLNVLESPVSLVHSVLILVRVPLYRFLPISLFQFVLTRPRFYPKDLSNFYEYWNRGKLTSSVEEWEKWEECRSREIDVIVPNVSSFADGMSLNSDETKINLDPVNAVAQPRSLCAASIQE